MCEFDLRRDDEVSCCNTSGNQLSGVLTNITAQSGVVPIHAEVKLANGDIEKGHVLITLSSWHPEEPTDGH